MFDYSRLTAAYEESNARENQRMQGKTYEYVILDEWFNPTNRKGITANRTVRYDEFRDENIYSFADMITGDKISISQFYVKFIEVREG